MPAVMTICLSSILCEGVTSLLVNACSALNSSEMGTRRVQALTLEGIKSLHHVTVTAEKMRVNGWVATLQTLPCTAALACYQQRRVY